MLQLFSGGVAHHCHKQKRFVQLVICVVKGKLANKKWSVSRLGPLNVPIHKSIPIPLDSIYRYHSGDVFPVSSHPYKSLSEFL